MLKQNISLQNKPVLVTGAAGFIGANLVLALRMTEKSPTPETHWCCPPFYYYTKEDAQLVRKGIEAGCGTDAPGSYIAWLCTQTAVYAMEMPGSRYDIGNLQSYEAVQQTYRGVIQP